MQKKFDFVSSDDMAGFRLQRFEVLNWGTFHKNIWTICPEGQSSLLTGDIGSGKSTLVDGLTSLLVPPQKIIYNKAAGAESRERSLRSYVYGYFKSEKDAETLSPRSIALRGNENYSVLLASFFNEGFQERVTLAQVFRGRDIHQSPDRFYVIANRDLSISEAFSRFGKEISDLKKRLARERGIKVFDSFTQYATEFKRRMGIENAQALDLFYQTVSMKSVGNLTDFVRQHMLEEPPVQERIEGICRQFDDLNRAHEAVLKARRQVEMLTPIATETERFRLLEAEISGLKQAREALYAFFAGQKADLLERRIRTRKTAYDKMEASILSIRAKLETLRSEQRQLERAISENGGRRLEELTELIDKLTSDRKRIAAKAELYMRYCKDLKLPCPSDESSFLDNRSRAAEGKNSVVRQREEIQNKQVEQRVRQKEIDAEAAFLATEIESLKGRRSNIPYKNMMIRAAIAGAAGVSEDVLPFAGELLKVRDSEAKWEGAAERLLHNFGLSLLVPEEHYAAVASYVDRTHLEGRLVYFRASAERGRHAASAGPDSLLRKIEIMPDTPFYDWLEAELGRRFDYACCAGGEEFRRLGTAVTVKGQIKTGGLRHEKDDRYRIDDRSRYILGWNNREKLLTLQDGLDKLLERSREIGQELQQLDRKRKTADGAWDRLQGILSIETFAEIDWHSLAVHTAKLEEEKRQIQAGSDILRTLQAESEKKTADIRAQEELLGHRQANLGKLEEGLNRDEDLMQASKETLADYPGDDRERRFTQLTDMMHDALGERKIAIETCDNCQTQMRGWLQRRIDNEEDKSRRSSGQIIRAMQ